ncbi:MAG: hypothetical protein U0L51_08215 [Olegusella sp.]|nr:hypothetical protein [Olegusella sp.]
MEDDGEDYGGHMARPGSEQRAEGESGTEQEGRAVDALDQRGEEAVDAIEKAGGEALGDTDANEALEASIDADETGIFLAATWSGLLPPPDQFNRYPPDVQKKIVEWSDRTVANNDALTESAIKLDLAESDRLDALTKADIEQVPRVQWMTAVINIAMIVAITVLGIIGQGRACSTMIGIFGLINVASLFVDLKSRGRSIGKGDEQKK